MMTLGSLQERYTHVKDRVASAARRSGRGTDQVMLVAVTKTAAPDQIRELIQLGHTDFGENKVQQLLQNTAIIDEWMARHKTVSNLPWSRRNTSGQELLPDRDSELSSAEQSHASKLGRTQTIRWHMIGHLQRNKVKKAIEMCRLIHSVDTMRLAEEIQQIALRREQPVDVLLQVNCSGENQKFGCAPAAAPHVAEQIETMLNVRLRGLMTMAALTADASETHETFARCRELFEEIRDAGGVSPHFNILSMGMSNDFEVAIEEGANLVRVGSAIFGQAAEKTSNDHDENEG